MPNSKKVRHLIVGGGLTGLFHAYRALQKGEEVILIEKKARLGGLIQSQQTQFGLVERAANGILNSRLFEELTREIGLEIAPAQKSASRRYIYHQGHPRRLPLSLPQKIRLLWGIACKDARPLPSERLADWATRTLGPGAPKNLIQPAFGGIYAGDICKMDAGLVLKNRVLDRGSLLRQLLLARKKKRHLRPKIRGLVSPKLGMGFLIEALGDYIRKKARVRLKHPECDLSELRKTYAPKKTTLAMGLPSVLPMLCNSYPELDSEKFYPNLSAYSLLSVTRFATEPLLQKPAFGLLFKRNEGIRARGVLFNNFIFEGRAKEGLFSETWIYGGAFDPGITELSEEEILAQVENDRTHILPGSKAPIAVFPNISRHALPAYEAPLAEFNSWLDENLKDKLQVEGNFRYGVGLSAILERAFLFAS